MRRRHLLVLGGALTETVVNQATARVLGLTEVIE